MRRLKFTSDDIVPGVSEKKVILAGFALAFAGALFFALVPVYTAAVTSLFLIGVGMGIATNLVFEAAQLGGQVLGIQMGYSLVNILDPQTQVQTPVISLFYQSIVMLLFLRMDVHYWLLRAVGNSYAYLPPGTAHINGLFTMALFKVAGDIFGLGIQIAAPVLSATLAADVVLGLLGKASPQMPLMLMGPAVKSMLGVLILIATLKYWPDLFGRLFLQAMNNSDRLLHLVTTHG